MPAAVATVPTCPGHLPRAGMRVQDAASLANGTCASAIAQMPTCDGSLRSMTRRITAKCGSMTVYSAGKGRR
jgi:hypothetical protein